jgi:hypothetical protein
MRLIWRRFVFAWHEYERCDRCFGVHARHYPRQYGYRKVVPKSASRWFCLIGTNQGHLDQLARPSFASSTLQPGLLQVAGDLTLT